MILRSWNDRKRKRRAVSKSRSMKKVLSLLRDIDMNKLKPTKKVKPW